MVYRGPPAETKVKVCRFYDEYGDVLDEGCPRPAYKCWYIHPEDPEWPYDSQGSWIKRRSRSRSLSPRSRGRRRSRTPPRQRPPDQGWARKPASGEAATAISTGDPGLSFNGKRLPTGPAAERQGSFSLTPTEPSTPSLEHIEQTRKLARMLEEEQTRKQQGIMQQEVLPTPPPASSSDSKQPIPSTSTLPITRPTISILMTPEQQPPPPESPASVPHTPSFLAGGQLPDAPEFDSDIEPEVKSAWDKRIELLADSVQAAQLRDDLQENLDDLDTIVARLPELPDETKAKYTMRREKAVQRHADAERKLEELLKKLVGEGAWPISLDRLEGDIALRDQYAEMVQYVGGLKTTAKDMSSALVELGVESAPVPPAPAPPVEDAMEVDSPPAPAPSLPRRHTAISEKELDDIYKQIADLHAQIEEIDNATVNKEDELRNEFTADINAKVEEFLNNEDGNEHLALTGPVAEELHKIHTANATHETNLTELVKFAEEFQVDLNGLRSQVAGAMQDYQQVLNRQNELQKQLTDLRNQQAADSQSLTALQEALKAHMVRGPPPPSSTPKLPSPPLSPRLPSTEVLLQAIQDPLTSALRSAVRPMVEEARAHVQERVGKQAEEIFELVWDKVRDTIAMLEAVDGKLEEAQVKA